MRSQASEMENPTKSVSVVIAKWTEIYIGGILRQIVWLSFISEINYA